ncbi:hypothetical protein FXF51_56865 [Nonomuraea sp. PA05]|uniref:hypothetical protein n=1 Tax=Nonomuraea sp. PA05 TaxID=2604466 RepID=UPI0011DC37ED|nr:hypothetical protein [Nonomuraea sp. PA05]TYB50253.1 hypothetical protein FXF51_56865 [Nonomuraea sp. PA05]
MTIDTASELRPAAARLREAARKATPGPWTAEHPSWAGENAVLSTALNGHAVAVCGEETKGADHPASADAAWIALASPLLAEPLAALLEHFAAKYERLTEVFGDPPSGPAHRLAAGKPELSVDFALAVARIINGRQP